MRGILINPFDQTIKEVVYTGDFREVYVLIECQTFDCVNINYKNIVIVHLYMKSFNFKNGST